MDNKTSSVADIINMYSGVLSKPEAFVSTQENVALDVRRLLKQTYDFTKKEESNSSKSNALPELIVQNFDLEQIWQQIELQNDQLLGNKSIADVSKLAVGKNRLLFDDISKDEDSLVSDDNHSLPNGKSLPYNSESDSDESEVDAKQPDLDEEEELEEGDDDENADNLLEESDVDESNSNSSPKVKKKFRSTVVDDEFFKLDEMNSFLVSEERKTTKSKIKNDASSDSESEESVNLFEEGSENDEEDDNDFEGNDKVKNPRYKDFFGTRAQQRLEWERKQMEGLDDLPEVDNNQEYENREDENQEDENQDDENEPDENMDMSRSDPKSTLELREERLNMKIKEIEEAAVSEKPWQLKGEITAENRPQNSLLEEVLQFDLITRPAPVITQETTYMLEDVIRQRIKDKAFDDVERKEKPVETPLEFKKKLMLNQEKSKESLAQIYEKEFVQQRDALNPEEAEKEEEEPKLHQEIKTMMHSLFSKLDALSNFHFTPKPAAPELKIVSNLPAINMEEVAPVSASDAALLAPEEIKAKAKGDILGKGERTDTDKKRERRKKKQKQRYHAAEKSKKEKAIDTLKPGLGNKYSKEKAKKMLEKVTKDVNVDKMDESHSGKHFKSSTAFFAQLQEEVKSQIKNKTKTNRKAKKTVDAKRMKL